MSGEVVNFTKCMICGEKCSAADRNTDGTYAHAECLRKYMQRLLPKARDDE